MLESSRNLDWIAIDALEGIAPLSLSLSCSMTMTFNSRFCLLIIWKNQDSRPAGTDFYQLLRSKNRTSLAINSSSSSSLVITGTVVLIADHGVCVWVLLLLLLLFLLVSLTVIVWKSSIRWIMSCVLVGTKKNNRCFFWKRCVFVSWGSIYFRIVTVFRTVLYYFQTSQSLVQSTVNTVDSRNQGIQGKTSVKALFALLFFGVLSLCSRVSFI